MNRASIDPSHAELLDQLSAYLDGELDADASRQVEERIARDETVRRQLRQLEQAWRVLDELPRIEVQPDFTRTTVEMIALREQQQLDGAQRGARRKRVWAWIGAACGLAAASVAGFFTVQSLWPHPNDLVLRDLPIIERVDAYRQIDDIEFLRMLKQEKLFVAAEARDGK